MTLAKTPSENRSTDLAECGWREETIVQPDGTTLTLQVPLTEEEYLHPQEDYHLPNSTFHDQTVSDAREMLTLRYENRSDVAVFHDLLIKWDIDLKDHSPDICVVFGIQDKQQNRETFVVVNEGVRPAFILEVVSPRYRRADRERKVVHYAVAGVEEYVIVDRRRYRGQILDEVLGYHLVSGHYQPITPDEEGRICCETVGLWVSLQQGRLVLEDTQTGERLLTPAELRQRAQQESQRAEQERLRAEQESQRAEQERLRAEQESQRAEQERQRAEQESQRAEQESQRAEQERQRAERLAEYLRSQGIDPDQI
jgi:Uma2 family endonuclease